MKPLDLQNHYETLEIPIDASAAQIERAYGLVRAAYEEDSLALYSLFDPADAGVIRERIDLAYRVLSDPETRRRYDTEVLGAEASAASSVSEVPSPQPPATEPIAAMEEIEDEAPDAAADVDGAWLRRARMRRGIEIDQIATITKINPTYLRLIEEEGYDELPAPVYVRGFVTAYARAIGIDPTPIAARYMARLQATRDTRRGGRLLGLG